MLSLYEYQRLVPSHLEGRQSVYVKVLPNIVTEICYEA
jgi:hypothetical protein